MFCAPGLVFGGTEGVGSRFHVLRSRTRFRRYQGRRVPFSCFARSYSFSAMSSTSGPIFMFCAPVLVLRGTETWGPVFMFCAPGFLFGVTEGVGSRFHVLRAPTRFRLYRGRLIPFSCFMCLDSFSAMSCASGPVFLFCAPVLVLRVTEAWGPVFMFCMPGLVFDGTVGVGSCFHVLCARTRFRRY
jgi:hypothetical protein